jgi:hypothetical protein
MPIYDPSSCLNCRYVCRAIEQLDDSDFGLNAIFNDSIPGLREVIQQRNKRHPLHSSGDSAVGNGRIPNKLVRKTCIIGRKQIHRITRMWYLKQFPAYSESSDEEFREHIAKKMRLKEEDLKFYDREDFNRDFYKNDSLKNKYRDYYKFPIFYTYGWDYDADGNANPLMEHVNKWENFHRLVSFCCQPEEVSSWRILEKRTKTYHDPVYLPNKGEDKHDRGIKERDEFAIIPRDDWKDLNPGGLARVIKKYFTWTAYEKKRLRWKLTRGSVGSYHNERTQAVAIAPLNSKMRETLVKEGSPFYSQSKCDCGGTVRYDEHLALVCDKCSAFYGYKIVTDNFMNMRGEEEESGDDDSWNINELDAEGDENPYTQINYDHTNYRRIKRLTGNLEDERQKKEKEEQRKIEYIRSNSREKKAAFLDYKISILLKQNGDGLEQASLRGMLKEHFNTDVTHSAIKSAINRMEEKGQVKTADMYTRNGKRIFVRLIAKT